MIVQQINISFTSAMAETIRIHTGESGRQIIFTPDFLEDIPNDHEVDVIIVKPDNTFVIALASVGSDGKIYTTIPEQAGAVSGVGHYILKVYDNDNLCIYSACGGFYIDDHLLTDEMLESIAEVYGYRFPQDFAIINDDITSDDYTWSSTKIADEIANATPDIIDDDEVLYDKTWSSEKISYELGNVPMYHVYSTDEKPVGRWIDGKTLYEKTYTGIAGTGSGATSITVDANIKSNSGNYNVKEIKGLWSIGDFGYMAATTQAFGEIGVMDAATMTIYGRVTPNGLVVVPSNVNYGFHAIMTIRYTKTTD